MLDRLPWAILAGIVGWCLGWASARLTEWLQTSSDPPEKAPTPLLHGLIRDPFVQGPLALVWAAAAIFLPGDWLRWAGAGLLAVPLVQVAVTDFRTRYVYDMIAWIGLAIGLAVGWQVHGTDWWTSLAGAAGGFAVFGVLYLLGLLYKRRAGQEGMARGDVTIAAMVGAGSAACTLDALVLGIFVSGLMAIGVLILGRSRFATIPFGPGLCLGGLATLFWC
jgi:prepilin signal peptidase PulO-like enzyme (type II secretory pathway)